LLRSRQKDLAQRYTWRCNCKKAEEFRFFS